MLLTGRQKGGSRLPTGAEPSDSTHRLPGGQGPGPRAKGRQPPHLLASFGGLRAAWASGLTRGRPALTPASKDGSGFQTGTRHSVSPEHAGGTAQWCCLVSAARPRAGQLRGPETEPPGWAHAAGGQAVPPPPSCH